MTIDPAHGRIDAARKATLRALMFWQRENDV